MPKYRIPKKLNTSSVERKVKVDNRIGRVRKSKVNVGASVIRKEIHGGSSSTTCPDINPTIDAGLLSNEVDIHVKLTYTI